jgi:small subunit ribosomal protein S6
MPVINYETVFITEPEIANEQVDQLINKIKQVITTNKGAVTGEDRWGRRRLAYPIQGHREGFYTVLTYNAEPAVVSGLEHLFNITDTVVRHLTIRVIKKNKTFRPRRERPAGATDARTGRPTGSRPPLKVEPPPSVAAAAASAAPAAASTPAPAAAPATPAAPATSPETGAAS